LFKSSLKGIGALSDGLLSALPGSGFLNQLKLTLTM
jgi:hypothetical protein